MSVPLMREIDKLTRAINHLRLEVKNVVEALGSATSICATKKDLEKVECSVMSKLTETLGAIADLSDAQKASLDVIETGVAGLAGDLVKLNKTIKDLQETQGGVTPEDQTLIDKIQATATASAAKAKVLSDALAALDEQTPAEPPAAS